MQAVVGISDHCGWAECITVGVRDNASLVLDRRRATLIAQACLAPRTTTRAWNFRLPTRRS